MCSNPLRINLKVVLVPGELEESVCDSTASREDESIMSDYLSQTPLLFYLPSERICGRKLIDKHNDPGVFTI